MDPSREKLVYVVPERTLVGTDATDEIDLFALWDIVWAGKWLIIATTVLLAVISVVFALSQTNWYRAEVLLAPVEEQTTPSIGGQLGGLAALAGVSVGGGESAEAIATLRSRDFARDFIAEFELLPMFFAGDWDAQSGQWRIQESEDWPDLRDAIKFFHENVLTVTEGKDTGFVTLSVEWIDPDVAAFWAMELARRLNQRLRERALLEAETNVAYLQGELSQTNVLTLQQSIGRLLESELQKLMLARGNEEFAFRVVDAADVPKEHSKPRRALIAIIGTMLGGILGMFIVFVRHMVRSRQLAQA